MSLNTSNIIHIVVEVITLLSITIYFMQQNKRMMDMIDSLSEQVEEQEEKIKKHDSLIADIFKTLKDRDAPVSSPQPQQPRIITPITSMLNSVLLQQPSLDKFPNFFTQSNPTTSSSYVVEEDDDEPFGKIIEEEEEEEEQEEEEEYKPPTPPPPPPIVPEPEPQIVEITEESVKKKKKKKKKSSSSSSDIDKELEDELNELYKEELLKNNS
jgi:hypothetical protein